MTKDQNERLVKALETIAADLHRLRDIADFESKLSIYEKQKELEELERQRGK